MKTLLKLGGTVVKASFALGIVSGGVVGIGLGVVGGFIIDEWVHENKEKKK